MSQSSFACTQLYCFMFKKWLHISIRHIDGTQTGTTTIGPSGSESNGNEGVLYIPQSSCTGASPLNGLVSYQDIYRK